MSLQVFRFSRLQVYRLKTLHSYCGFAIVIALDQKNEQTRIFCIRADYCLDARSFFMDTSLLLGGSTHRELSDLLKAKNSLVISGAANETAKTLLLSHLLSFDKSPVLVVTESAEHCETWEHWLKFFGQDTHTIIPVENGNGEIAPDALQKFLLFMGGQNGIFLCARETWETEFPSHEELLERRIVFEKGKTINFTKTVESLVAAGRTDAAVLAARGAWLADSAISPRLARLEPVVTRQRQVEWTQRLRPLPLVVTGDSVVASWELLGAEPLVWHAPGLPLNLSADISIGNDTVEPREETFYIDFWITWRERPAALQGTISALMPDLEAQLYSSRRTPPVLGTRVTRAEAGGRLVVTVHGGLADELRRRRPAAAKARGSCSPWSAEPGRCSPVTVPIEYRAAGAAVSP